MPHAIRLLAVTLLIAGCNRPLKESQKPCQGGKPGAVSVVGAVNNQILIIQPTTGFSRDDMNPTKAPGGLVKVEKRASANKANNVIEISEQFTPGIYAEIPAKITADKLVLKNASFVIPSSKRQQPVVIEVNELELEGASSLVTVGAAGREAPAAPAIEIIVHNKITGNGTLNVQSKGADCPR